MITPVDSLGKGGRSAASSTLTFNTTAAIPVGGSALLYVSADNLSIENGNNDEHLTVIDSAGGVWSKLGEYTEQNGTVADGVTVSIWLRQRTLTLVSSGASIVVTFNGTPYDATACGDIYQSDAPLVVVTPPQVQIIGSAVAALDGFASASSGGQDNAITGTVAATIGGIATDGIGTAAGPSGAYAPPPWNMPIGMVHDSSNDSLTWTPVAYPGLGGF